MGNCVATGHAAGLAAALSAAQGCRPRDLDVGVLQGRLRADGVPLPYYSDRRNVMPTMVHNRFLVDPGSHVRLSDIDPAGTGDATKKRLCRS
jgi:hypothetical protein